MSWLGRLFGRRRLEADLDRELRFHLEAETRDLVAAGVSPREARRRAALALGGLEQVKEAARDARGTRRLEDWWQDTRFAFRTLRRTPAFAGAAILILAIGIGANTAVFTLIDALVMTALPVPRPGELSLLRRAGLEDDNYRISYPELVRLREVARADSVPLAAMAGVAGVYATGREQPEPVVAQLVSGDWFPLLGVEAAAGRVLGPGDDLTEGGHPVAVLSYDYWTRRYGRSPSVVGDVIRVNQTPLTVVGIAPPGFRGLLVGGRVDLWMPIMQQASLRYVGNFSAHDADPAKPWIPEEGVEWLTMVVRAPPARTRALVTRLDQTFRNDLVAGAAAGDSAGRRFLLRQHLVAEPVARGVSPLRDQFATPLFALMASVAAVLLVASANLASLLLARGAARRHEIAVRVSLGARPGRLVRQVLTESVTLAVMGAVAGLGIGRWGSAALVRAISTSSVGPPLDLALDARVLSFTLGVALLVGVGFGLAPALQVARTDLHDTFRSRGAAQGGTRLPGGRILVVSQIALSLMLVVVAGLFARTLGNLLSIDPGYDREQVLAARLDPRSAGYPDSGLAALYQRIEERVGGLPGVRSVSLSGHGLAMGSIQTAGYRVPDQAHGPEWDGSAQQDFVTPGYFETVGIPVLRGRAFHPEDRPGAPRVAVLNRTAARYFFGTEAVLGQRIGFGDGDWFEIVGVVGDARVNTLRGPVPRMVYHPAAQPAGRYLYSLEVRVIGAPQAMEAAVRSALAEVDPNLPVRDVAPVADLLARGLLQQRLVSRLATLFGALAALLAAIGLYGVLAYSVARRTNELGVRLALGARAAQLRWLVLRETLALVVLGVVAGLALLVPLVGLLRGMVFGLSPRDPTTMAGAALALLAVGAVAGMLPAWRASRVDPAEALRSD